MTEQTVRSVAKEIAGAFYDQNRTPGFRQAFPTLKAFNRGQWHQPDGSIKAYRPGWLHFVEPARRRLAQMLGDPATSDYVKNAIFNALIEDRNRQFKQEQRNRKMVKDLPQGTLERLPH